MSVEGTTGGLASGLIGTVLSGRYRLDSKLGSGGMSTVYLARDDTLERWVAVKVMHREISDQPDQIERFRREARAVAQLSHPNLVAVIDAGEDGGHPYIVFEYVEGETLKQRIDRIGPLPFDEAAAYAIEIGRGIAAAHAQQMVHRDVKPQNVLIDPEGRGKVTDFGIARSLESDGLTKTGRVLGTTDYVSPEQAMGRDVDARSDIYSLGVVLYEMLTGDVPFKAETVVGVAMKHVNEQMPDVQGRRPGASAALSAVTERATQKDPRKRYPDMWTMLRDLEGALEVEVARAGGAHGEATAVLDSVDRGRRLLTTRSISLAGVLLVLGGLVAALAIVGLGGDRERRDRSPAAADAGAEVKLVDAVDFDPQGTGGEHPDEVGLAIDGIPRETGWTTESYTAGPALTLSGKEGVGLLVEAEEALAARELQLLSSTPGWSAEVYGAAEGPPADLAGFGEPIGEAASVDEEATVALDATEESRFYLIWITALAGSGPYSAEISDVRLFD